MKYFLVTLFSLTLPFGLAAADEEKQESTPNPAQAGFPHHWKASSWDTATGATFWTSKVPQKTNSVSSEKPISQTPQPNDFLDRQSEK